MRKVWTFRKEILNWMLAFLFAAGAFGFYGMETAYDSVMYYVTVFALHRLISKVWEIRDRKVRWSCLAMAVLFTATLAAGRQINTEIRPFFPDLSLLDWAYLLPLGGLVYVCILNLMDWILRQNISADDSKAMAGYGFWIKSFAVILVSWMPYFLIFYPGNVSWDSLDSIEQIMGTMAWSNWHPVVYTASIGMCMKLGMLVGDINFGIACYTLAQMLIMAAILSYCCYWIKKQTVSAWFAYLCVAFFALNPIIPTYAVTIWKDVLFSAFLLLLVLALADVTESGGMALMDRRTVLRLIGVYLLIAFWRNNGIYILMAVTVIMGIVYRKYWKHFLLPAVAVLAIILYVQGPVYEKLGISSVNFAESAGILLQQIAYTLEENTAIDAESLAFLNQILPLDRWSISYAPAGADGIKFDAQFNNAFFNANSGEFLKLWLRLLPANFGSYVKAWLMNTLGYFHVGTNAAAVWYGIIPLPQADAFGIVRTDLLQCIMKTDIVASVIEAYLFYMYKLPVFNILYSIAASVWMSAVCIVSALHRKKYKYIFALLPLVFLWGTMMVAAPVNCEFRYMFAFHLALPIMILFTFLNKRSE